MKQIQQAFSVSFNFPIYFTEGIFKPENPLLRSLFLGSNHSLRPKAFFIIDSGVIKHFPQLNRDIQQYMNSVSNEIEVIPEPLILPGGEQCKNDYGLLQQILKAIHTNGIDRHSYVVGIGGGAVLDLVGFGASIAHRGIRHIRIPTTVLSQNDSGVGVKNGINIFNKKNFLGTFTPPYAVLNDFTFLSTLEDRDWRAGISEAIKVSLIKDKDFFEFISAHTQQLLNRDMTSMQELIFRCAELHIQHIKSGDPFELGSSRPLDFGHWAAHKLEQLTSYAIRHGEAVALGMALDVTYSHLLGLISSDEWERILKLLQTLKFDLYIPEMSNHLDDPEHPLHFMKGLTEFREHLGGKLTIMLLHGIGKGVEYNEIKPELIIESIAILKKYQLKQRAA